jgi:hypothetical protein
MPPWQIDRTVGIQKFKNDRSLNIVYMKDEDLKAEQAKRRATETATLQQH